MNNQIKTTWTSIPPSVSVVAVTKTFPFETVAQAHVMGLRHIGENRVEEARGKIKEAKEKGFTDIVWHMVGHVQSRKTWEVAEFFDWVDSVDSVELVNKLGDAAGKLNKKLHVLLEVNLSGEKSKYGFDLAGWEQSPQKIQRICDVIRNGRELPYIVVEGFMTMAPYVTNPEDNRKIFRSMKKLLDTIRTEIPTFGGELSMGTSSDYQVAIEEGATQVRLGEALFGPRQ